MSAAAHTPSQLDNPAPVFRGRIPTPATSSRWTLLIRLKMRLLRLRRLRRSPLDRTNRLLRPSRDREVARAASLAELAVLAVLAAVAAVLAVAALSAVVAALTRAAGHVPDYFPCSRHVQGCLPLPGRAELAEGRHARHSGMSATLD